MTGHDEFTVNLVAHHLDVMRHADGVHVFQFGFCPYPTCGVVGVAKQEHGGLLVGASRLEILPVNLEAVGAAAELQYAL